jgi:hypothetical protein
LKGKANTHRFPVLHFSTSVGYKGEIILLANLVYFMYAWYRDGHIVSLCRVCSSFVYAVCGEWPGKEGTEHGTWRSRGRGAVGRNSTSPPLGSAAAISTAAAPGPNGTSTSTGIGTPATLGPNGTSTSAGIHTSATPGGDATSSSAVGNDNLGSAEPHCTTFLPTAQAATSAVTC